MIKTYVGRLTSILLLFSKSAHAKDKGKIMYKKVKQRKNKDGYMVVTLWKNFIPHKRLVHELVAEAFVPNPKGLKYVRHKNGNKIDNRAENLEWCDKPER